jgi:single-strand DNA-binding protein
MANLNRVFLMGNLTRDPELRYVPSGKAVTTFTIAINRVFTSQTGEKKEIVSFIRIVVWGRRAEVCGEYLSKGSPVFVEGRLQSRSWEGQDGQKRSTIEVVADNVQFLRLPARQQGAVPSQTAEGPRGEVESIDLEGPGQGTPDSGNQSPDMSGKIKGNSDGEVPF